MIKVRKLSKAYTLQSRQELLKEEIASLWKQKKKKDLLWALNDVSFDIAPGEMVSVTGVNGAGKSTLLKLLSRVILPTSGEIYLSGRVGALLEVGAGFHAELSGRENIFLSGAILGMRRSATAQKLDEIVAFAEVEPFLDTPIKKYSSGMFLRLAFSVMAHLDSEILIIDEVLSIADAAFQKKAHNKLHQIASTGRTLLLTNHQFTYPRTLHLDQGSLRTQLTP
jgi:lipopolysaccharide transport system ATP-binding protein